MHTCVISSEFFCVHKSTYWNIVNTRVHQQFYCVSCGGINNQIWIFSLHFDIRSKLCSLWTLNDALSFLKVFGTVAWTLSKQFSGQSFEQAVLNIIM